MLDKLHIYTDIESANISSRIENQYHVTNYQSRHHVNYHRDGE